MIFCCFLITHIKMKNVKYLSITRGSVGYWACVTHLSFCFEETYYRTSHRCFPPSFGHLAKQLQRRYLEIDQSETRMACGGHVYWQIGTKRAIFIDDLPRMLPTMFRFIWQSGFRGDDFLEINQSETRIACGGHVC